MDGKQELMVDFDNPFELSGLIHHLLERLTALAQEQSPGGFARKSARQMASLAKSAAASHDYLLAGKVFEFLNDNDFDDDDGLMDTFLDRVEADQEISCKEMEALYWTFLDHRDLGVATARVFARNGNYDFMHREWATNSHVDLDDLDDHDLAECLEAVVLDAHLHFVHGHGDAANLLRIYCDAAPRVYKDPIELWRWFALDVCDALDQYDMGARAPITEAIMGWPLPGAGPQLEEVRTMLRNADTWKLLDVDGYPLWWLESWDEEE
jgi:hypothetical protein